MDRWNSVDEVLDFAIAREQEAADFYSGLAERLDAPALRDMLRGFAQEEKGHKKRLLRVRSGGVALGPGAAVTDLRISDYLVDVVPGPHMNLAEIWILAMKREKAAFRLYTRLADMVGEPGLRSLFLALAQQEARHKLRFEIAYDDYLTEG
jgi:rubrerythrin